MDTLANLKAFVSTADTGSFSKAARQSGLVPSVIAKRIDQLEWRIHAPLFTRSTRKLTLTDVGERYLPRVRQLVREMEETLNGMAHASGDLEGHIRIKIPTTLGTLSLSTMLNDFLQEQPRVSMDVVLADRSVNPIEEGFDIAIGALPELYGQVKDYPLCPLKRHLCAAPVYLEGRGMPQQAADLIEHDCLVFTTSGSRWDFQSPQGLVGVDVRPKLKTNDGIAIREACIAGLGISVLPNYLGSKALQEGRLLEILPQLVVPDIWLKALVPNNRMDLPRIRMLLQWLAHRLETASTETSGVLTGKDTSN
jgi:DNA-binding transcriptional LysR family regulator